MRSWTAIEVTAQAAAAEAVEYAFNVLGSLGTEINYLAQKGSDDTSVVGYFDQEPDAGSIRAAMSDALAIYGLDGSALTSISTRSIPETDWLAEWKMHWQPTEIERFIIAPPWAEVSATDKILIRIEPNMAFGTGTHETTRLCLRAIDKYFRDGMSFLDVGTGTGILSIAAAKISPTSHIAAYDVDEDAIMIARENAAANETGDHIEFFEGTIEQGTPPADFVCANLTLDVIRPLLPRLIEKTNDILLLSGILTEQADAIRRALYEFAVSDLKLACAGEWLSVIVRK